MIDYNQFTADLARYPREQTDPKIIEAMYASLGLAGETGEAIDKIKKWHRDGVVDPKAVALELGDALYYLTRLANTFGFTLEQIQQMNIDKLESRRARGVLQGSGDNR